MHAHFRKHRAAGITAIFDIDADDAVSFSADIDHIAVLVCGIFRAFLIQAVICTAIVATIDRIVVIPIFSHRKIQDDLRKIICFFQIDVDIGRIELPVPVSEITAVGDAGNQIIGKMAVCRFPECNILWVFLIRCWRLWFHIVWISVSIGLKFFHVHRRIGRIISHDDPNITNMQSRFKPITIAG